KPSTRSCWRKLDPIRRLGESLIRPPECFLGSATPRRETGELFRGQAAVAALVRTACPLHPSDIQNTQEFPQARCTFLLSRDREHSRARRSPLLRDTHLARRLRRKNTEGRRPRRVHYKRERNQGKAQSHHAAVRAQLAGLLETVDESGIALLNTSCKHRNCEQRNPLALLEFIAATHPPRLH